MKINGNTIKCWASLKERVGRLNMALPPQNGAAINPHCMVAAIVITTVVIHITFITVTFVFTVLILLPVPSQEGEMLEWIQTGRFSSTCRPW